MCCVCLDDDLESWRGPLLKKLCALIYIYFPFRYFAATGPSCRANLVFFDAFDNIEIFPMERSAQ